MLTTGQIGAVLEDKVREGVLRAQGADIKAKHFAADGKSEDVSFKPLAKVTLYYASEDIAKADRNILALALDDKMMSIGLIEGGDYSYALNISGQAFTELSLANLKALQGVTQSARTMGMM